MEICKSQLINLDLEEIEQSMEKNVFTGSLKFSSWNFTNFFKVSL